MTEKEQNEIFQVVERISRDLGDKKEELAQLTRRFEEEATPVRNAIEALNSTLEYYKPLLTETAPEKVNAPILPVFSGGDGPRKGERGHRNWVLAQILKEGEKYISDIKIEGANYGLNEHDIGNVVNKDYKKGRYGRRKHETLKGYSYATIEWYDENKIEYERFFQGTYDSQMVEYVFSFLPDGEKIPKAL